MTCRYCDKPIPEGQEVKTHSYWQGDQFWCHSACKQSGERAEAIECQTVDADCNDCLHFQRGSMAFNKQIWNGRCLKFDKLTQAFPKKWTGHKCFEHRRSLETARRGEVR